MISFDPHTNAGIRVVELYDELLRLHGRLLSVSKAMASGTELRSMTRVLVLSSVVSSSEPPTVARIARSLGYTRQAIQRIADELAELGYLEFQDNPHHKKAMQLVATKEGMAAYQRSNDATVGWADRMGTALGEAQLTSTVDTLRQVRRYLEETGRSKGDKAAKPGSKGGR